jgi:hypothetical protein
MDTRKLFQKISQKMRADFEISAQIKHNGSKGTVRENNLRNFLAEGRLPYKYALGGGEIVGRVRDTSYQCDIIVYDKLNGVTLLYDESVQVFPIDSVYGIIEVKSALSKTEFLDALEKIKAFKAMAPGGAVSQPVGGGFTLVHSRSVPFGAIFAYNLAGNSLQSLLENLQEWEKDVPPAQWPNYICVLEAGIIEHNGKVFEKCHDSEKITSAVYPMYVSFAEDSLFQFYCAIHDMCAHMQLGPVELRHYYDPAIRIGKFTVYGRGVEGTMIRDGDEKTVHMNEAAIERVVSWCASRGRMSYGDTLMKRLGTLPLGMDGLPMLDRQVFLYNPDNLPGIHELDRNPFEVSEAGVTLAAPSIVHAWELIIDDELYIVASQSFKDNDFEAW